MIYANETSYIEVVILSANVQNVLGIIPHEDLSPNKKF